MGAHGLNPRGAARHQRLVSFRLPRTRPARGHSTCGDRARRGAGRPGAGRGPQRRRARARSRSRSCSPLTGGAADGRDRLGAPPNQGGELRTSLSIAARSTYSCSTSTASTSSPSRCSMCGCPRLQQVLGKRSFQFQTSWFVGYTGAPAGLWGTQGHHFAVLPHRRSPREQMQVCPPQEQARPGNRRLILMLRSGQAPLLVVAPINPNIGLNFGSCL